MDRGEIFEYLDKAEGQIARGKHILMKQRELVEILRFMGRDATGASTLLGVAERTRATLIAELNQLLSELKQPN